ncbi:MAG: SpoIIE family protein phosphatase, partial [Bacteroidia bacterium]|nr:SpoIIE family protein phosphatase [Bacteroidia bacterium]
MKKPLILLLLLLVFYFQHDLLAQSYGMKHYMFSCYYRNYQVRAILQESNTNVFWVGTNQGLLKFTWLPEGEPIKQQELKDFRVVSIYQDRSGKIWFGTDGNGIFIYDGVKFKQITKKHGLTHNKIRCFFEDRKGTIWIGTYGGGVTVYTGNEKKVFKPISYMRGKNVFSIVEDRKSNKWFGTNEGVYRLNGNNTGEWKMINNKDGLCSDNVFSIHLMNNGNLLFGTDNGVCELDPREPDVIKSFKITTTLEKILKETTIFSINGDSIGNLWFSTFGNGLGFSQKKTRTTKQRFLFYQQDHGLCSNKIQSSYKDSEGRIWVATKQGLSLVYDKRKSYRKKKSPKIQNPKFAIGKQPDLNESIALIVYDQSNPDKHNISISNKNESISSLILNKYKKNSKIGFNAIVEKNIQSKYPLNSIIEDQSGNTWFATFGDGLYQHNLDKILHLTTETGLPSNEVLSLLEDNSGNIWFTTYGNGVSRFDGQIINNFKQEDGLTSNYVKKVYEDNEGNLWFGSLGGGVSKYADDSFQNFTVKDGLSSNIVYDIVQDNENHIWFATNSGVSKYDGTHFRSLNEDDGLSSDIVTALAKDSVGNIWLGTYGGGLDMYNGSSFINFNTKDGLTSDYILLITIDDSSNIWLSSDVGINKFNLTNLYDSGIATITSYDSLVGPNGIRINPHSFYTTKEGNVWFGINAGNAGNLALEEKDMLIYITNIRLNFDNVEWSLHTDSIDQYYPIPKKLSLSHDKNHLTFEFVATGYLLPKKIKYKYKLEGLDENWSPKTVRREAVYPNIPPGYYQFKVKALNKQNKWNKTATVYRFHIEPALWQTLYFQGSVSLLILLSGIGFIQWRTASLKRDKRLLQQKVEERTKELAQKNKDITDSITYAKQIQSAILPPLENISNIIKDYFVLYKPRDIVSGDFYWFHNIDQNKYVIAACDCTGHGVPGSLMSMVGNDLLNQIVVEKKVSEPGAILEKSHTGIRRVLRQDSVDVKAKDGMDMVLCTIDINKMEFQYSGAHNPLYYVTKHELIDIPETKTFRIHEFD